ncbi:hypothetical protein Pan44_35540 [Caulifigura coniformis]|uniref:Uncharacterized protein n=1 Tax=Caulifigura coniformis TaxID=2527983 RepID=A0A517SHB0_9PLAN|nr:hypothetical protein [Caulifigura coniformis]QDT55510.1 hypothetical protein Pan44_35540 [Caulifigura coniformis]
MISDEQLDQFIKERCQPGKSSPAEFADSVATFFGFPGSCHRDSVLWMLKERGLYSPKRSPSDDEAVWLIFRTGKAPNGLAGITGKPL